jgi:hypothetical protein
VWVHVIDMCAERVRRRASQLCARVERTQRLVSRLVGRLTPARRLCGRVARMQAVAMASLVCLTPCFGEATLQAVPMLRQTILGASPGQ